VVCHTKPCLSHTLSFLLDEKPLVVRMVMHKLGVMSSTVSFGE
jgi:hypothetical protein